MLSLTSSGFPDHGYSPWSELPKDILTLIVARLKTTVDVANFGQVCDMWNAASYFSKRHPSKQFPWILLSERDMSLYTYFESYSNPDTGCRRFLLLPKRNQLYFPLASACRRRCVGSGAGWLLMLSNSEQIIMLCPLSGTRIPLPPQTKLKFPAEQCLKDDWQRKKFKTYISKIILGKDNSGCTMALAIAGAGKKLAIARPRGRKWTALKCKWSPISDVIFYQGHIYAVNKKGILVTCNADGQAEKIAKPPKYPLHRRHNWYIVVSTTGNMMLVAREYSWEHVTKRFTVFELQQEERQWQPVKDLGDQALFLGFNTSTSLQASGVRECEANCVYFTDDNISVYKHYKEQGGGYDTGKYSLTEGSLVNRYYVGDSSYSPPLWYFPKLPSPLIE